MSTFDWIGETESTIYAANKYGVLSYDREEGTTQPLTKTNYLSETGISSFKCSPEQSVCIIGYSNGNIDFIRTPLTINNQPAILNKTGVGNKVVNDIFFEPQRAWLATGLGIILMDLETGHVMESAPIVFQGLEYGVDLLYKKGNQLILRADSLILTTEASSIFESPVYQRIEFESNPKQISGFFEFHNQLYAIFKSVLFQKDTIYQLSGNSLLATTLLADKGVSYAVEQNSKLLVTHSTSIVEYDSNFVPMSTIFTYGPSGLNPSQARPSIYSNRIIVADHLFGGIETSFQNQYNSTIFNINSPRSGEITIVDRIDDEIFALPGGTEYTYLRPHIQRLTDSEWTNNEILLDGHESFVNSNCITKTNNTYYVGANRGGLALLNSDLAVQQVFDATNSPLDDLRSGYKYYGVTGVDHDENGNVYLAYNKNSPAIKILSPDGKWFEMDFPNPELLDPLTDELSILSNGLVATIIQEVGILLVDPNETPTDFTDDNYVLITSSPGQGSLPSNEVLCFTEDNDGALWIGTSEGICIIYNTESTLDGSVEDVERPIVQQDGYNGYLFETEAVTSIAVDGANRKWVGTANSGLFLVSPDGLNQIAHFRKDNSPIPSNSITDLAIQQKTGELFIATESGLISYRSDAVAGSESLNNMSIFPNPVKPGYSGVISISNLTASAYVRITNVSGDLIFETRALGGQASWTGLDMQGRMVESGVYLIHAANANGQEGKTEKILFLK